MIYTVELPNIENTYKYEFDKLESQDENATISSVVKLIIKLYKNTKIAGVDNSAPDNDMLLFEYGVFGLSSEQPALFTISFTRQFCIEGEEEYYQISQTFSFDKENFVGVDNFNQWSTDCSSTDEWIATIQNTVGFRIAEKTPWLSYNITLDCT
ncbi:hypothetical protein MTX78_13325 [Hymenobacter tibetensis]|uniref:Uncharacterized protein n=1 Tax=Hymenobacter tibetensis TaxID=497967 RepID=A0ABY4CVT8_9BACT|nr:hypothetical protein [Hymenobacter tibetensis]UOG73106.1 hypothetical protein MTX78_13325 [Hymenobacter tibetensis]